MLGKEKFFKKFNLEEAFKNSGLFCKCLETTDDDYCVKQDEIESCMKKQEQFVIVNIETLVYLIQFKYKNPVYFIEKIIRKKGKEQIWRFQKCLPRIVYQGWWELIFSSTGNSTYLTLLKPENSYAL